MQCPYCGGLVADDAVQCNACGAGLAEAHARRREQRAAAFETARREIQTRQQQSHAQQRLRGIYGVILIAIIVAASLVALALQGGAETARSGPPW